MPVPGYDISPVREGRVEICFQGVWGSVFDTDWSALDAAITCQQLGFNAKGNILQLQVMNTVLSLIAVS